MTPQEAIVRLACIVALPTDAELVESEAADAGEYLLALRDAKGTELEDFISERKVGWQREPRQKVHRCVSHLCSYLVRVMETNQSATKGEAARDMMLTEEEVDDFERKRRKGGTLSQLTNSATLLDGICAAASICRTRLLFALRKVEIFGDMSSSQLETLRDAMVDAPFEEGQFVFEQGEEGDSFYVITEGEAEALREEEGSHELIVERDPGSNLVPARAPTHRGHRCAANKRRGALAC